MGSPGKIIRSVDEAGIANFARSAAHYVENAHRYLEQLKAEG
jgi:carbonic anhydrase/acetyltransferase-like protein (isoleucine patch superfamily)